jgi:di/tricarboxylate transporter
MNTFFKIGIDHKREEWLQRFARFGFASIGIVYCLMGILTVMAALGLSSKKGDKSEAFRVIYDQPFGKILLLVIAAGMTGYVTLRIFQAFFDTNNKGSDTNGIATRVNYASSAVVYLSLIIYAIKLASGNPGSGNQRQFFVSKIMGYPMGEWIVGITGLIIIGVGFFQIYLGISKRFMKQVELYRSGFRDGFQKAGMIGYAARGIVFSIVGYFLLRAAIDSNPKEADGTREAFDFLQQNFGNLLMGVVALGLIAYGIFMFVRARHENIHFSR